MSDARMDTVKKFEYRASPVEHGIFLFFVPFAAFVLHFAVSPLFDSKPYALDTGDQILVGAHAIVVGIFTAIFGVFGLAFAIYMLRRERMSSKQIRLDENEIHFPLTVSGKANAKVRFLAIIRTELEITDDGTFFEIFIEEQSFALKKNNFVSSWQFEDFCDTVEIRRTLVNE